MKKEYKVINDTSYHKETNDKVISILENARISNKRIRIFYGDTKTGRDWKEEFDTIGTIGRSTGINKIPLLIKQSNSWGGGALLDHCIVKITIDKKVVYQHENYHIGEFEIKDASEEVKKHDLFVSVFCDNENIANFKTAKQAERYVEFLKGNRNSK